MTRCKVCTEKDIEIGRILEAYKKDKKFHWKVHGIMGGVILLTAFLGNDGVYMIVDLVKGWLE